jgi:hypothetical protein
MPGPKPAPISSQLRFSNENTTTDRYRAGGARSAPHGVVFGVRTGADVVVVLVLRRGRGPSAVPDPEPDEHAASSSTVAAATPR